MASNDMSNDRRFLCDDHRATRAFAVCPMRSLFVFVSCSSRWFFLISSTRSCCRVARSAASEARRIRTRACTEAADAAAASLAFEPGERAFGDPLWDPLRDPLGDRWWEEGEGEEEPYSPCDPPPCDAVIRGSSHRVSLVCLW